jgi:hypothetical protein
MILKFCKAFFKHQMVGQRGKKEIKIREKTGLGANAVI